jgi:hypothetical protein
MLSVYIEMWVAFVGEKGQDRELTGSLIVCLEIVNLGGGNVLGYARLRREGAYEWLLGPVLLSI